MSGIEFKFTDKTPFIAPRITSQAVAKEIAYGMVNPYIKFPKEVKWFLDVTLPRTAKKVLRRLQEDHSNL